MVKMTFWNVAERDLQKLPHSLRKSVLLGCREIFDDWGIGKMLTGSLSGYRMHCLGVYRIIYIVKESSHIEIVTVGHRRDIYERAKKG
jgi:mRNA-degrading endonuclease RelE of RelBE toxin-antitoxin system